MKLQLRPDSTDLDHSHYTQSTLRLNNNELLDNSCQLHHNCNFQSKTNSIVFRLGWKRK